MKSKLKTVLAWTLLILAFAVLLRLTDDAPQGHEPYASLEADMEAGVVQSVRVENNAITVERWDGYRYQTLGVVDDGMVRRLSEAGVEVAWGEAKNPLRTVLIVVVPLLIFLGLFGYFLKKSGQGGMGGAMSFKKSRARLIEGGAVRFADVGGLEEEKALLGDLIDFLKHPDRWSNAGVRLPRGVLLDGPPGCGKTLLARAVAGETDAKFFLVSASEFVEMFVGVGAARVRDMFETASKEAPAVIFIDELDAVGRKRGSGIGAGHDEREQTLNQILVCMDGFEQNDRVVVIAATNRADILDAALLRPGRFDRRVEIGALSLDERRSVLEIHTRNKKLAEDVSLAGVAQRCEGWTGAQLEALANEAGLLAVRRARDADSEEVVVTSGDFEQGMKPAERSEQRFDRVDALIMESTTQLAQSNGRAQVRVTLLEGECCEGELLWADAMFIKVRGPEGESRLVPKNVIKSLEALDGTEWADADDVQADTWLDRRPDLA